MRAEPMRVAMLGSAPLGSAIRASLQRLRMREQGGLCESVYADARVRVRANERRQAGWLTRSIRSERVNASIRAQIDRTIRAARV